MEYKKKKEIPVQKKANTSPRIHSKSLDDNRASSLIQRKLFEQNVSNVSNENTIQKMEEMPMNDDIPVNDDEMLENDE